MLTGPAGSGKTTFVLDQLRRALEKPAPGVRLLTPTATMAEHIRNRIAREGFVLRPRLVETLSKFTGEWTDRLRISDPALFLSVERAIDCLKPPAFARVAGMPGFTSLVARTIEEFSAAGLTADTLPAQGAVQEAFLSVFAAVESDAGRRGWALQSARMEDAAGRIRREGLGDIRTVWLDGFFSLTDPELRVVEAISQHAGVAVTLPDYATSAETRERLLGLGFTEEKLEPKRTCVAAEVFAARNTDDEAEEIARLLLKEAARGRPFREMGVLVRTPDEYLPVLRAVFERHGIPARFYFDPPLSTHGSVRFLSATIDALLGGWDWEATRTAIRMDGGDTDHFDFAVRERMPGRALDGLRDLAGSHRRLTDLLDSFAGMDAWLGPRRTPQEWRARLAGLRGLVRVPKIFDAAGHDTALGWRAQAAALDHMETALAHTAECFDADEQLAFEAFWRAARSVFERTTLAAPDRRRNVVHVLSVFEARQWELPVIFVCGLLEKQFPRYYAQNPIYPDAARRTLRQAGFRIRTAAEREAEEQVLFELARTRATARLVLSYPRAGHNGEENLPSLFLEPFSEARRTAPAPSPDRKAPGPGFDIRTPDLLAALETRHSTIGPTALETFVQCPFQFFGRRTLRLESAPARPEDRLDPIAQGSLIHSVLAEWHRDKEPVETVFSRMFDSLRAEKRVPEGYRTESLRIQMLDDLRRFVATERYSAGAAQTEVPFEWEVEPGLVLKGRIDRLDVTEDGRAVIIDYKYANSARVRDKVRNGRVLQAPLYVLACETTLKREVAGMFYLGLKKDVKCAGWGSGFGGEGEPLTQEWLEAGLAAAREAISTIRAGSTAPEPDDTELCGFCELRDVCRHG